MKKVGTVLNYIRLALFPIGYGVIGALVGGTLNRVFIADIGLAATLVGFVLSIQYLVSPVRVWLGYRSDGFPIFGKKREWYMIFGVLIFALGLVLAVFMVTSDSVGRGVMIAGMVVAFTIYGIGRNLGHNSYQALLTDIFSPAARQRAITLYEVATLVGSVAGAGALGSALEEYDPARLVSVTIGAAVVVFLFAFVATIGQEPKAAVETTEKARSHSFMQTVREIVLPDPQVRMFFLIVLLTFVGTLAQDDFLEPYGALVLGMNVGETTRLTAFWGVGVLVSMLFSGLFLVKRVEFLKLMRVGIVASIFVFLGVIGVGLAGHPDAFRILVLVMGLATGVAGAGMLSGVVSFTTSLRAGLLMGVWGMANLLGKAVGGLMGGVVIDVMRLAFGDAFLAYATLFGIEVVLLVVAFVLTGKLDIRAAKANEEVMAVPA